MTSNSSGMPTAGPSNTNTSSLSSSSQLPQGVPAHTYSAQPMLQHHQPQQHQRVSHSSVNTMNHQSGMYAFSVHQPYANWPHHSHPPAGPGMGAYGTAPWYPLPPHAYGRNLALTYQDESIQTDSLNILSSLGFASSEPKYRKGWDAIFSSFLRKAKLLRTLRGFEEDMIVMNESWEKDGLQEALEVLQDELMALSEIENSSDSIPVQSLQERKLDYVKSPRGVESKTPSKIVSSISKLIAQSRMRNDSSNRKEFLYSAAEKRRRINEAGERVSIPISGLLNVEPASLPETGDDAEETKFSERQTRIEPATVTSSCARVDAKPQDRDLQMKYDIAKNEDGPLRRTVKSTFAIHERDDTMDSTSASQVTAKKHPGLAERFVNVEKHLAVRYVPSPPVSLLDRLKYLEDHIVQLEIDYPPWAALHFNQPHRGWPPPPRIKPIIIPSHLTSVDSSDTPSQSNHIPSSSLLGPSISGVDVANGTSSYSQANSQSQTRKNKANLNSNSSRSRTKSSLHRAVMERLEVQKAMGELGEA